VAETGYSGPVSSDYLIIYVLVPVTICYEQPLNERVRLLLRLEFLFEKVRQTAFGNPPGIA